MQIGSILKQAWQLPWKHHGLLKIALVMSIPSGLISGFSMAQYLFLFPSFSFMFNPENISPDMMEQWMAQNQQFAQNMSWITLINIPLSLISMVILFFSAVALVKGVQQLKNGKEEIDFTELRQETLAILPRVFLLNLALYALMLIVGFGIMIAIVLFGLVTFGIGMLCVIPFMFVVGLLSMALFSQTNIALILEDFSITDAIKYGWAVVRQNTVNLGVMSFLLSLGGFVVSLFMIGPSLIFSFVLDEASVAIKIGVLLVSTFLSFIAYTFYFSFSGMGWILTYYNLPKKPAKPFTPSQPPAELQDSSALEPVEDSLEQDKSEA